MNDFFTKERHMKEWRRNQSKDLAKYVQGFDKNNLSVDSYGNLLYQFCLYRERSRLFHIRVHFRKINMMLSKTWEAIKAI